MRLPTFVLISLALLASAPFARAQQWTNQVRGSWVQRGAPQIGDLTLAAPNRVCEIVVAPSEEPPVQQAARFLAADIQKISGYRPPIVARKGGKRVAIILTTPPEDPRYPFTSAWESYKINTGPNEVRLVGSDARGTAYAAYTLSERLGIDPLYHWTGYTPERRNPLVLKQTALFVKSPAFKFRGMFHDDEDILPRPFDPRNGYPYMRGIVPDEWYERFFETALRLRMNQVAPFTRVKRPFHIQKLASDWGLFYTSHHYDILLSNPYGFERFNLARERGVKGEYDYLNNRDGVLRYWKAGADENRDLDAIYPVGLRGTEDYGYRFPPDTSPEEKAKVYARVIGEQVALAKEAMPPGKTPYFHLTLYGEMLDNYRKGRFDVPEDVMLIWDDDFDGRMRDLPKTPGKWKHGVYYHLAFFASKAKQSVHTITPERIAREFRKIVDARATEYMLVNVSELREHVMEARMLAEVCWDAETALSGPDPAGRYVRWWSREYFGADAAPLAAESYHAYHAILDSYDKVWFGSNRVYTATMQLMKKLNGEGFTTLPAADVAALKARLSQQQVATALLESAMEKMAPEQRRFFFEHAWLGIALDYYPTRAALLLEDALQAPDNERSRRLMAEALTLLQKMEQDIRRAERPPFTDWYRATWARPADFFHNHSHINVHRPHDMLRHLMVGQTRPAVDAEQPAEVRP